MVSYSKLVRYCELSGSYDLYRDGSTVSLSFTPTLPEAIGKSELDPPRVRISGTIKNDIVELTLFELEDAKGSRTKNLQEAEAVYKDWLDYIEENF